MNNYDMVGDLAGVAAESTGSSARKMETYLDSVEAKTNQLKATWEEFVMSLNQSGSYKAFLDFLIKVLKHMPTVIGLFSSLLLITKGGKVFSAIGKEFGSFGENVKSCIGLLTGLKNGFKGVKFSASAAATGIGLVVAALTIIKGAYDSYKQAQVEAAQKAKEEADAHEKKAEQIQEISNKYKEIYESSMSYTEKQEALETLSGQLKEAYGEEANALDLLNGSYEKNIAIMNQKVNAEKKLQLGSLKTAAKKGESNLNNWINHANDVDFMAGGSINLNDKNRSALQDISNFAGYNFDYIESTHYNSDNPFSSGQKKTHNANDASSIIGMTLKNSTTNEESLHVAQKLQEYLDENAAELDQSIIDMVQGFIRKINDEVDANAPEQFSIKQQAQLAQFEEENKDTIEAYNESYKKQLKLQQEFNNAKDEERKKELAKEYKDVVEETELYKQMIINGRVNENDSNMSTLTKKVVSDYLGMSDTDDSQIAKSIYSSQLDDKDIATYQAIKKEIEETGRLSDESRQKLEGLKKTLAKTDNGSTWIDSLNTSLEQVADKTKLNLQKDDLSKSFTMATLTSKMEKAVGNDDAYYTNINKWLNGVNKSLSELGMNVNAQWYQDLMEGLRKRRNKF